MAQTPHSSPHRRAFVAGAGAALLSVVAAGAAQPPPPALLIRSSPGLLGHVHELMIPRAYLEAPPRTGLRLRSSRALFHAHEFVLSPRQLAGIGRGDTVELRASSHVFVVRQS